MSFVRTDRFAGMADQAFLSAVTFGQVVLYARHMTHDDFGLFAMGLATVLLGQTVQRCVVVLPMIVSAGETAESQTSAWSRLNLIVLTSGMAILLMGLAVGALADLRSTLAWRVGALTLCMLPGSLLYEFVRRAHYVAGRRRDVLRMAATSLALHAGVVWGVLAMGGDAFAAGLGTSGAAALAALLSWPARQAEAKGRTIVVGALVSRYRSDIVWNLAASLPYAGFNTAMPVVLGFLSSPTAAGVFSATRVLLAPITTLISSIDSVDKPRAAKALRDHGEAGLARSLRGTTKSLFAWGSGYLVVGVLFSDQILRLLLGGRYPLDAGYQWCWFIVGALMMLGQPMETGLLVLRLTRYYFWTRLAALLASMAVLGFGLLSFTYEAGIFAVATGWMVSGTLACALLVRRLGVGNEQPRE